jgi:hypothetical protein
VVDEEWSAVAEVTYVVDKDVTDRAEAAAVCDAVLDAVKSRLVFATVDAYSDYDDEMTPAAREAQRKLFAMGKEQGLRDPGMGVNLDLRDPTAWAVLRAFAPWSINVDLWDAASNNFATFHDCGYSVVVDLSDEDASAIRSRLSPIAPVLPLGVVHARRRGERRASRQEAFRRVRSRLHGLLRR